VKLLHCVSRSEYPCCVRTRRLLVVLAISIVLANGVVCAEQAEISSWFAVDSPIWEQTSDQFMRDHASDGFRWASAADRQAARSPNRQLRFCGMPVYETVARFADGRLAGLTVSLYNVADAGDIDQEALEGLAETSVARITKWLEAEPEKLQTAMRDRARLYLREWNTDRLRLGLLWSYTRKYSLGGKHYPYRSEYVTVRILPPQFPMTHRLPAKLHPKSCCRMLRAMRKAMSSSARYPWSNREIAATARLPRPNASCVTMA
jgi:hypothetical protein